MLAQAELGTMAAPICVSDDDDDEEKTIVERLLLPDLTPPPLKPNEWVAKLAMAGQDLHPEPPLLGSGSSGTITGGKLSGVPQGRSSGLQVFIVDQGVQPLTSAKRKRDQELLSAAIPPNALVGLEARFSNAESKSARKKRRKLERQAAKKAAAQAEADAALYALWKPPEMPTSETIQMPGHNTRPSLDNLSPYDRALPSVPVPFKPPQFFTTSKLRTSLESGRWQGQAKLQPVAGSSKPQKLTDDPPPPPPRLSTIGDSDPIGKRGVFQCGGVHPHSPYAPRTLVMDSIPEALCHSYFIGSWCQSVCGAKPVYVEFDKSRALIEFPTPQLADMAFQSPQLKGRLVAGAAARSGADISLIRVWRYQKQAAVAPMPYEVEEGEIEERELPPPVQNPLPLKPQFDIPSLPMASLPHSKTQPNGVLPKKQRKALKRNGLSAFTAQQRSTSEHDVLAGDVPSKFIQPPLLRPPLPPTTSVASGQNATPVISAHDTSTRQLVTPPQSAINCEAMQVNDNDSIASSRPNSPALRSAEYHSEDMDIDVESPVTLKLFAEAATTPWPSSKAPVQLAGPSPSAPTVPAPAPCERLMTLSAPVPRLAHHSPLPSVGSTIPPSHAMSSNTPTPSRSPLLSTPTPPSDAPSEPRAMRAAPTGPSYAKRSLLAKQKELEQTIARSTLDLKIMTTQPNFPPAPTSPLQDIPVNGSPVFLGEGEKSLGARSPVATSNTLAAEEQLRRLVLKSKRNKDALAISDSKPATNQVTQNPCESSHKSTVSTLRADAPPFHPDGDNSTPGSSSGTPVEASPPDGSPEASSSSSLTWTPNSDALGDLAVSFITEAIQTATPPPPQPSASLMKLELAARQKRLEEHISETKMLMAELDTAGNKQEREVILIKLRQLARVMDGKSTPLPNDIQITRVPDTQSLWPQSQKDSCLLIVSDDEDEE